MSTNFNNMKEMLEKLNKNPIDWCFNCASIGMKDVKKLMFTYIFVNYVRTLGEGSYSFFENGIGDSFIFSFKPGFLKDWDNVAINKSKNKKSYYKGLIRILDEHLHNCGINDYYKYYVDVHGGNLSVLITL